MWTRSFSSMRSVLLLLLAFSLTSCHAQNNPPCIPSSCGNIKNITFPFRLKSDPRNCGNPNFELDCQNNQAILNLNSRSYSVQSIDYDQFTIRMVDSAIENNDSCSFPPNPAEDSVSSDIYGSSDLNIPLTFLQCLNPANSSRYVDISLCSNRNSRIPSNSSQIHRYIVVGNELTLSDLEKFCSVEMVTRALSSLPTNLSSLSSIHEALVDGIELSWRYYLCKECYDNYGDCSIESNSVVCRPNPYCSEDIPLSKLSFRCKLEFWGLIVLILGSIAIAGLLGLRFLCGLSCLIAFVVYKRRRMRKNLPEYEYIEGLCDVQDNFKPIRYSYYELKKMTNNFKERLGTGGYGTVFKGKLRSGPPIVVKMMDESMSSVQEYVSLVSALAGVRHDNVMQLLGFCLEGEKRALVYDFMQNGSLLQYINAHEGGGGSGSLSYEKMFEIFLEVARGIDHLHRNCDMRTFHLGIKPQNVLLDDNLSPKISDFGLAKLYPLAGNMAPEFYYKKLGEVSYKADVYSYGILLMEMVGKIRNIAAEYISPVQFPKGNDIEMRNGTPEEMKMVKKMIVVALWCIQMLPDDRPSMNSGQADSIRRDSDRC